MSRFLSFDTLLIKADDICSIKGYGKDDNFSVDINTRDGKTHHLSKNVKSTATLKECLVELRNDIFNDKKEDFESKAIRDELRQNLDNQLQINAKLKASELTAQSELKAAYLKIHELNDKIALLEAELGSRTQDDSTQKEKKSKTFLSKLFD